MSFSLRSPGDKAGASAQHVWAALQGQDCCVHSACGADMAFYHGNAASGQGEDGSDFVLANIDSKQ